MIVLGIDGSLSCSGITVLNTHKKDPVRHISKITTATRKATPTESTRLKLIHDEFKSLLEVHNPDIVIMEDIHMGLNKKTGLSLSRVRGVYQLLCSLHGVPFGVVPPASVKKAVTNSGNASKELVYEAVKIIYKDSSIVGEVLEFFIEKGKDKTEDMSDSLAVAHTYLVNPSAITIT